MLDTKDFSFFENQNSFDFKGFLIKTLSYWKWFVLGLAICLYAAYYINLRKQPLYSLDTTIAVQEQTNPLFTSNTSLTFNWGGTSDKVQSTATTLRSRSHNEIVVDKLDFYIDYSQEEEYFTRDVYGYTPFVIKIEKNKNQIYGSPIEVKVISENELEISKDFASQDVTVINYANNEPNNTKVNIGLFKKRVRIGENINLPFLHARFDATQNMTPYIGQVYFITMNSFDGVVANYKNISVSIDEKAASILRLSLQGTNKPRIVAYLNETVTTLTKRQLDGKNLFAENTIKYIDTTLATMEGNLKDANEQLKKFSQNKNLAEIQADGATFQTQLSSLDLEKELVKRKINYYNTLQNYLKNSTDYSKLPAPSGAGIEDPNIQGNIGKIIDLSIRREKMAYSVKSEVMFNNIDNEINSVKNVLLENIRTAKSSIQMDVALVNSKIQKAEGKLVGLPEEKQEYFKIMRKYDLSENIYQAYLQKRSEASIVKAANLSDIEFIDPAKDIGGGMIGPRTDVNYVIATFMGILVPLLVVFLIFFINNAIQNTDDISNLTNIPLIGVVGLKRTDTNLSVFERPKSALSESFRAIRSSLQFLYKRQNLNGSKTLMVTSSVSGEGKTYCSMNIATVFALSEKKTVIVGLDLRKPKIFSDFDLSNDIGVVNYLIGQKTIEEITLPTHIPFLDVITSGPIPPNPSELIMGDGMKEFMDELKLKYDYIILDTPPVGLVTDAIELSTFADVTLYIMRQNFTRKDMINLLNNRVKRGELNNVSIVLNGYQNKAKYGAGYGYGYGYGYGSYSNGYHEEEEPRNIFDKYLRILKRKFKIKSS
jgi:capsular exopolysaccharide synthesis family protein